jgi:hypothetical protein
MKRYTLLVRSLILAVGLCAALATSPAQAFDTGHHSDLTRDALQAEGFGDVAIETAQLQNWLVDYYSSSPTSRVDDDANRLHFDNLFTPDAIRIAFDRFKINAKTQIQDAARDGDELRMLTLIGITFHSVQDFYSHSNWVELHPRTAGGPYRTETYFGSGPAPAGLFTGRASYYKGPAPASNVQDHGGYTSGINHDAYGRPRWDEAYVFAYVACREWAVALKGWVNDAKPGAWDAARSYSPNVLVRKVLDRDHWAAYRISEWVKDGDEDGHWKGKGSGDKKNFLLFSADWVLGLDSRFVDQFKGSGSTLKKMSAGIYDASAPSGTIPSVSPLTGVGLRAVIVRTVSAKEGPDNDPKIDGDNDPADFYAKITVAGQTFTEATIVDRSSITPAWTTIKFLPAATPAVAIHYELWDEDDNPDDQIDINPLANLRAVDFAYTLDTHAWSGLATGVHDSVATAFTGEGKKPDDDRGIVQFYVTTADLVKK